jgi:hypothetical protein
MSLLSDALFSERLARPAPSSSSLLPLPLVFVSQLHIHFQRKQQHLADLDDDRAGFSSYLIIHHLLGNFFIIASFRPLSDANRKAPALHSQVEMTGAALVGRRWADRLCRDHIDTFLI